MWSKTLEILNPYKDINYKDYGKLNGPSRWPFWILLGIAIFGTWMVLK